MHAALLVAVSAVLLLGSCAGAPMVTRPGSGAVVHVVAFWLDPDTSAAAREAMTAIYLERVPREVPGVEAVWLGPARPSDRDVVDDSFSLMTIVRFSNGDAEIGWQTHAVHDALRASFADHLQRVVVYDFIE